jgi:hypothetical protein
MGSTIGKGCVGRTKEKGRRTKVAREGKVSHKFCGFYLRFSGLLKDSQRFHKIDGQRW